MVVLVAVVAVVVVVEAAAVVEAVRGVKLAFGTRTFNSFYAKHVLWRRWWWRCEEGARRPGLEGQVLRHVFWCVLRHVLRHVLRRAPFTCSFFTCCPRAAWGAECVC